MNDVSSNKVASKQERLTSWSQEQATAFGVQPVVAKHQLHRLDLFNNATLIDLLDTCPRDYLQVFTMGDDVSNWRDWQPVDTKDVSGKQLFDAIARGRFWCHILKVQLFDRRYYDLIEHLYADLSAQCDGFHPFRKTGTLLLSSPHALVYYHVDAEPNLLWHIRGTKRVWVYPAGQKDLISQELMEDIFAHVMDEEVPYKPIFDNKATSFDLLPGDVATWPLNAPHRVTNLTEINVSLSTIHETMDSDRRKLVYCANRLFRHTYHLPFRSTKETGIASSLKRIAYRAWRRAGFLQTPPRRAYVTNLRISPEEPTGVRVLEDGPVLTEFSQKDFVLKKDGSEQVSVVQSN